MKEKDIKKEINKVVQQEAKLCGCSRKKKVIIKRKRELEVKRLMRKIPVLTERQHPCDS